MVLLHFAEEYPEPDNLAPDLMQDIHYWIISEHYLNPLRALPDWITKLHAAAERYREEQDPEEAAEDRRIHGGAGPRAARRG